MPRPTIDPDTLPSEAPDTHFGAGYIAQPTVMDTVLCMLNEHAAALDNVQGDGTADALSASSLTVVGDVQIACDVANTRSAAAQNSNALQAAQAGTFDTTDAGRTSRGMYVSATSTRSAGANSLTNVGIEITAAGAQSNIALKTIAGDCQFNTTSGTTRFDGNVGFYGTAPIAKQTGVAVDAAAIHAALVALGLIGA